MFAFCVYPAWFDALYETPRMWWVPQHSFYSRLHPVLAAASMTRKRQENVINIVKNEQSFTPGHLATRADGS
ncbi:MAG: hypothetical protein AUF64_01860 [Chloroflexi bacterium 13_1_20CM_54_36]|nr:MAG: hypothetical protein AUF64_01860 [Chloroflexi bacterium 13_1_20CM_54_36]